MQLPISKPEGRDASTRFLSPGKILIVEDEEDMVELLNYHLKKEHYRTMIASTGRQACALVESFKPDCILLDIMLPEMDGWEVCRLIRQHSDFLLSSTPIVMLTALSDEEAKIKGLELGADAYIGKPYSIKDSFNQMRQAHSRTQKPDAVADRNFQTPRRKPHFNRPAKPALS